MTMGRLGDDLGESGPGGRHCSGVTSSHTLTAMGTRASRNQQGPESSLGAGMFSAASFPVLHIPPSSASMIMPFFVSFKVFLGTLPFTLPSSMPVCFLDHSQLPTG